MPCLRATLPQDAPGSNGQYFPFKAPGMHENHDPPEKHLTQGV